MAELVKPKDRPPVFLIIAQLGYPLSTEQIRVFWEGDMFIFLAFPETSKYIGGRC
jgi:hypothetical protein